MWKGLFLGLLRTHCGSKTIPGFMYIKQKIAGGASRDTHCVLVQGFAPPVPPCRKADTFHRAPCNGAPTLAYVRVVCMRLIPTPCLVT